MSEEAPTKATGSGKKQRGSATGPVSNPPADQPPQTQTQPKKERAPQIFEGKDKPPPKYPQNQKADKKNQPAGGQQPQQQAKQGAGQSGQPNNKITQKTPQTSSGSLQRDFRLSLFDHLPRKIFYQYSDSIEGDRSLHPVTLKIGLMFNQGLIREDDDRVAALLAAFCSIIEDYKTPPNKSLTWDLDKHIKTQVQHLVNCRQHSMAMGNLIKYLRFAISRVPPESSEADAKSLLISQLHSFLEERILYSREVITEICTNAIRDEDVILTFGSSPLLRQVFAEAAKKRKFKLIIVDVRPLNDGLKTLEALSPNIPCVYTTLAGANSALERATKVILGASALLSNGAMLAPAGTAMVCSLAVRRHVPVIVACEGYKFCDKVQVDSIVYNELGSQGEIAISCPAEGPDSAITTEPQLDGLYKGAAGPTTVPTGAKQDEVDANAAALPFQVLNLRYDLTPVGKISAVACETGLIPPTSIPVLLREFRADSSTAGLTEEEK